MKDTRFIFGIYPVKAYIYNWVYTLAQIELILVDRPLVLYKDDKGKGGKSNTPSSKDAQRAYEDWLKRKNGDKDKGSKIKLNDWIENG